ncbi:MAG: UbiD family decarboxylase [Candidatus Thermoplasmatota archaeon]|nr:UbiD family decarboxylase [Candidatus Thermoplasmatota archaeon]
MAMRRYLEHFEELHVIEEAVKDDSFITKKLRENPTTPFLFEDFNGFRVAGNVWATRERIARALDQTPEDLLLKMLDAMKNPADFDVIEEAPVLKNIVEDVNLTESPITKWYPKDGGRYVTSGVVVAELDGKRNMSFHRMMVLDETRLAARVVPRHLYAMWKKAIERGEELKIAVAIGLCPSILLPAGMSVSYETDELRIAAALRLATLGENIGATKIKSGLTVPGYAEYILEGRMIDETAKEGPFVDITGTYDIVRDEPVVVIDRIYHMDDPIFHALLPGGREHYLFMGMPREPQIYDSVKKVVPKVGGVRLTEGGCCWLHGVVSIEKQVEGDQKNAMMAAFTGHPSMKRVVVVDTDIDIYDDRDVEWALATRFQADRGMLKVKGARGSSLDPSAEGTTTKLGLDATKPLGGEGFDKAAP